MRLSTLLKSAIAPAVLALGLIAPAFVRAESPAAAAPTTRPTVIRVAIYADSGAPVKSAGHIERVTKGFTTFETQRVMGEDIRQGKLSNFDVLVCPGGTGGGQAKSMGEDGREKVREFVKNGGGFLGICAGSYLASSHYDWSLNIINTQVIDRAHWARGNGDVEINLTEGGKKFFKENRDIVTCRYAQGPLMGIHNRTDLPPVEIFGTYKTEINKDKKAPEGIMIGTGAFARSTYHNGRVVCFSPHPEQTDDLNGFVRQALVWLVNRPAVTEPVAAQN